MTYLAHYEKAAKTMTTDALRFAIADIKKSWAACPEFEAGFSQYSQKLWAEWDAYIVEIHNRENTI